MLKTIVGDITKTNTDVIINASNGIGFMGGIIGKHIKCEGVAESIHYETKGIVEKECKQKIKIHKFIPAIITPVKTGKIIITGSGGLQCNWIFHAVTMVYPGTWATYKTVRKLTKQIIEEARNIGAKSIAIPLLGTGVGHLKAKKVVDIYKESFSEINDIDIYVYVLKELK